MSSASLALVGDSLVHALAWWGVLLAFGVVGWLAVRERMSSWHDAGWAVARPLAILAFAYTFFVAGHFLDVIVPSAIRIAWLLALLALVAGRRVAVPERATLRRIAAAEARFVLPFAFYLAMRGFSHDAIGLEKFMDFAFLASAAGSAGAPVPDPWFAGGSINYYYFGHYVTAFLAKASGTPPAYAYNLMLATLFGATFQLAYAFVREMTRSLPGAASGTMGIVAGVWLTVGGNVHGFAYGFVKPWLIKAGWVDPPRQAFLLSDPTRFVGWDPPTADKLIHEFPAYAFYVGDLHAHLLNLPNVLLLACVLLAWMRDADGRDPREPPRRGWLLALAWLVGLFAMSNSWDGLMYGVLLGAVLLGRFGRACFRGWPAAVDSAGDGLRVAGVTLATALPFLLHFDNASQGFHATHSHTPVWQWLVLYGLQATLGVTGSVIAFRNRPLLGRPETALLALLTAAGIAFALVPEFVYMKDIYAPDHYRSNTAFKFGFQAFVLLTLAACTAVALLVAMRPARFPRPAMIVLLEIVLVPPLFYAWFVVLGGFGVWRERDWTLDGQRYLALSHPEDRAVTRWLLAQGDRKGPLVEAPGDSYSFGARIATNTGIPAVLGWPVHEQLWRGSAPVVWERRDAIKRLYEAKRVEDARLVVERYSPRWIVVGRFERERYPALDPDLLARLGRVAFRAGGTFVVEVDGREPAP